MINEIPKHAGPVAEPGIQPPRSMQRAEGLAAVANVGAVKTRQDAANQPAEVAVTVDRPEAERLVEGLQQLVQTVHRRLSFKVDEDTGNTVIQVIDSETDKVLRQIPPDDIVALQKRIAEFQDSRAAADNPGIDGMLFSTRV